MNLEQIFEALWNEYRGIAPIGERCRQLLTERDEPFTVDHVALRTFDTEGLGLARLARPFLERGYVETGRYHFSSKRLNAQSLSDPNGEHPRVFVSSFDTASLTAPLRERLLDLVSEPRGRHLDWFAGQRAWGMPTFETYSSLRQESEYAAWVSVFGIRANHFTVGVNALHSISSVKELNRVLREAGLELNQSGGEVKGSPELLLEQSSTMADRVPITFSCGHKEEIRSCYMEFASRFIDPVTGELFDRFLSGSADRIFESTDEVE